MGSWTIFALGALSAVAVIAITVIAQDIFARRAAEAVRNAHAKALAAKFRGRRC